MLLSYLPFLDGRIFEKEVKSLLKHGYDVTMIVPRKNGYLVNVDGSPIKDRFLQKTFKYEGVKIVTYNGNKRTNSLISDPLYRLGLIEEADFYHTHELNSFYYGKEIKRALNKLGKKTNLIYDSRQLVPDPFSTSMDNNTKEKWRKNLMESLTEVDYIITVSDSIKSWFLTLNPLLPVEVIYNSPHLSTNNTRKTNPRNKLVVCHEGNFSSRKEDLMKFFSITDSLSKVMDFKFKIVGGPRYGESITIPKHLESNILLNGWVNYSSLPNAMADVDIGIIHLNAKNSLNDMFALPNKLFSFLSNGIPVVVNKCSDMEKFITTYHCGLVIDKLDPTPADYTKAILYLNNHPDELKQMSLNAKKIMKEYCWENMENRLLNIYDSLTNKQASFLLN